MGRVAFVFSGQGDQYPGMGQAFCRKYPAAASVFARCDAIRPGTSDQCFSGTADELKETRNTQPCMFAMEMATAAALESCGLAPDMAAGFSLGELAALTFAGTMPLEEGFRLVCKRGEFMQEAAEDHPTAMAAVLKLANEQVESLCSARKGFYPVNYNCPGQISVSGPESEMSAFIADVKQAGGRALPLKVKGGFHSPYMSVAARRFGDLLKESASFSSSPRIPVYSDVTAEPYSSDVHSLLSRQISSPVLWENIVRNMISAGVDTFVEVGPGKTLCNLISRTDAGVRVFSVSNFESLEELVAEVKAC